MSFDLLERVFHCLAGAETFFWGYIGFVLITVIGAYLTYKTRFFQLRVFADVVRTFIHFARSPSEKGAGTHPIKVFFASVGGMIGLGNVVGVTVAVQMGGPGALFWVWMAALVGSLIKYSEVFLGLKYRVANNQGGYDGGPMYFVKKAFKNRWLPGVIAVLLCIYGVEIYQFSVIADSIAYNFTINKMVVVGLLLPLVLYASWGGVKRVGKICVWMMPLFMTIYMSMCIWVLGHHLDVIPGLIVDIFRSAFTGHAAVGGFAGSTMILAVQYGLSRAAYSADIGVGYDSIIQSESQTPHPEKQAGLAILGVFTDNLICSLSILVVLVTGVWRSLEPIQGSQMVQEALSHHFSGMSFFMPFFLFLLAFTTLISYMCVGKKCATYLHPRYGTKIYFVFACCFLGGFTFFDQAKAMTVMSIVQAALLVINLSAILLLRKKIAFSASPQIQSEPM